MDKVIQVLIFATVLGVVSTYMYDFCANDLNVDRSDSTKWVYSIDTCSQPLRSNNILPSMLYIRLRRKIGNTRRGLNGIFKKLLNDMTSHKNQCHEHSRYVPRVQSATNLGDLLKTAVEAVSAISLNLTIINCHSSSVVLFDVHSDSVEIIPYLKGLLHRVPFSHTICQPQQTLDSMVNSEGLLPFTCKNLSRAISLYEALLPKLNELWTNELNARL